MAKALVIPTTKAELMAKSTRWKIGLAIIIFIAALLITWGTIVLVKRTRQRRILEEATQEAANTSAPATQISAPIRTDAWPLSEGSAGQNVVALQKLINLVDKTAQLVPDGSFGSKTKIALQKIGAKYYPVTAQAFADLSKLAPVSDPRPIGYPAPGANDNFPMQEGSAGDNVKALKIMINRIDDRAKLDITNPAFDRPTYKALITYVGTKYYPVNLPEFLAISKMVTQKEANAAYVPPAV